MCSGHQQHSEYHYDDSRFLEKHSPLAQDEKPKAVVGTKMQMLMMQIWLKKPSMVEEC
jgi:hypothetical protein